MTEAKLEIETIPERRWSWVWLVPIFALLLFGSIAWKNAQNQGPLVEIHFDSASGIKAEKTVIKHKSVDIGLVERIEFDDDMDSIIVHARLNKEFKPYLGDTTRFWIVSARIDGLSISGLDTLLSGSYIEMDWASKPEKSSREFKGEDSIPITEPGTPGRRVKLIMTEGGSIDVGSTVFYKKIKVGQVEQRYFSDNYDHVELEAFIHAPFDELITSSTKFWNAAGISVNLGDSGLEVQVESMQALMSGGVSFEPMSRGGSRIEEDGRRYKVYRSKSHAEESIFDAEDSQIFYFTADFDKGAKGLKPGAPVEIYGIQIGEVEDVIFDLGEPGDPSTNRIFATLKIQPDRIGAPNLTEDEYHKVWDQLVDLGFRVQLGTSNLLTGTKYIKIVETSKPDGSKIDYSVKPYPRLPGAATNTEVITNNIESFAERLSRTPIDELVKTATRLLEDMDKLVTSASTQQIPDEVLTSLRSLQNAAGGIETATSDIPDLVASLRLLLDNADGVLDGLSPESELYHDLEDAIKELKFAMRSIDELATTLEDKPNSIIMGK